MKYSPIIHVEVTEFSNPPEKPDLNGPTQGQPGIEYNFEATTTETDGDQIYYKWQWGDGSESIWTGPYTSGDTCEKSHIYDERGTYDIKVKAIDINGAESEWADPLSVTMPRNGLSGRPILILIKQILENFPILNRLLGI
jgi:PKD repeat protein